MRASYTIEQTPEGWGVVEDGALLETFSERNDALRLGCLLAQGAKAAGGEAEVRVVTREGVRQLINLDRPLPARSPQVSNDG